MNSHPDYFEYIDRNALLAEFPVGDEFVERFRSWTPEQWREHQNTHFLRIVERAWTTVFYQRLWGNAGIEKGDIRNIDDLASLPVYDKSDIMQSIERAPPWGDFHGIDDFASASRPPVITHTTSGTTGRPQVLTFGPRTREVQNLLLARAYRFQGLAPDDVVHSVYGHGLVNGGHYIRETVTHWTGARFLSAGTGLETPSRRQVEIMGEFGVTVLVGFADYLAKLASVARDMGIDPTKDLNIRMISGHIGAQGRDQLCADFGCDDVYDWYGVGDTGVIAAEGSDRDGLYVMDDAHVLEILDVDTGAPVARGADGDMVVTSLFTDDVYPIIRFNTHDVSAVLTTPSSLGFGTTRIEGFKGRSDSMVKLRGVNVFPHAIGTILTSDHAMRAHLSGEYICRVARDSSGGDVMTVHVESKDLSAACCDSLEQLLRERLGVKAVVELASVDSLGDLTGIESRQKPIRLIDER